MKKILFSVVLLIMAVSCKNTQDVKPEQKSSVETESTEIVNNSVENETQAVKESLKRPTPGNPVSYSYEEAERYANETKLKYKSLSGKMNVIEKSADGKLVKVEFFAMTRNSDDEAQLSEKPITLEVDLSKTRFFNYDESCDVPRGCMEVVIEEAHLENVFILVTEANNEKYPLVLTVQEDVAG